MEYTIKSNNPYESEVARMIEQFRKHPIQVMRKDDFKAAPVIDRSKWEPCVMCESCGNCLYATEDKDSVPCNKCVEFDQFYPVGFCRGCGRPLTEDDWKELEKKVFVE